MGKRVAIETQHVPSPATRTIRKRKTNTTAVSAAKAPRLATSNNYWHENDDEDSSSNDISLTPARNQQSSKHGNNLSILLNSSLNTTTGENAANESPKPVYTLRPSVVNGTILHDLTHKPWRLGRPIGKGNFGEIFLASDNISLPVTNENAKFVVKIEPHSNGPLFVEIHCLMNTAKKTSNNDGHKTTTHLPQIPPTGIPDYIASGSHYFGDARYRFLVLQRFDRDLHSLIKNCRVSQRSILTLAINIVNVLENLHDKGYCHNDVKAQNLMISKCKYYKQLTNTSNKPKYEDHYDEKQQTTDSGNSSEQEANDDEDYVVKDHSYEDDDFDEDFDDETTSNSNNSNTMDIYHTPQNKNKKQRARNAVVEYSGSNPVRSCRLQKRNSIYEEMVKSHYLRPTKRISYSEFFTEDGASVKGDPNEIYTISSDDESEEFVPQSARRSASHKNLSSTPTTKRITRRQEKLLASSTGNQPQHHQNQKSRFTATSAAPLHELVAVDEERVFLIDFGLASKFMDNGVHRPFIMDQRRAHDGTLEFTSRDAHMGAHSRRSDLECLGYNLIFWSQGYLPWKEAATQHQQEKVHRAKEYLMTDVREMLKQIYGKLVPKYLGEFLHQVGQLAHHERPDYARYRRIFEREYQQLGFTVNDMQLDSHDIARTCLRFKDEIENKNDIFEISKHNNSTLSIMKNFSVGTPFHECTLSNRVSPKNLRSKSDKKAMKKKKFSWAEILSQDPDQIARERAEKEFDREDELGKVQQLPLRRYEGNPTYAILEIQHRLKSNGQSGEDDNENLSEDEPNDSEDEPNESEDDDQEEGGMESISDEADEEEDDVDDDDDEDNADNDEDDDDNNNESEEEEADTDNEVEEEESNTDDSQEELQANGRRGRTLTRNKRTTTSTLTKSLAAYDTTTVTTGRRNKVNKKSPSTPKSKPAKKRTIPAAVETVKKRDSSKRYRRQAVANGQAASAAGEYEHSTRRYEENGHVICGAKPSWRRTRRCLIKTDAETEEEESNRNFSPDVRGLFNVWRKFNNDPIYFRRNGEVAKHCKK